MIDIKQLQTIIENLVSKEMKDFINIPDLNKNRLRQLRQKDILDSFSDNQFLSKMNLINHIKSLDFLNKDSEIVIFGSWYGSILIPAFYNEVKKITCIDMDKDVISRAKYELFKDFDIDFITGDVFEFRNQYKTTDLFINTSCEHMKPMREWGPAPEYKNPWWDRVSPAYFAFQSNAMFDIPTHINCVNNIEEFKKQLPDRAEVLIEDEIPDERGTRFTLIGKI
tara:strand:- start:4742 stop:5413 length:672 start_codon:yes stop_codon:yes gene_type:complete